MAGWLTEAGRVCGFPECCIKQFVDEFDDIAIVMSTHRPGGRRDDASPWDGTGFIPCDKCEPSARTDFDAFVRTRIEPNRRLKTPFPADTFANRHLCSFCGKDDWPRLRCEGGDIVCTRCLDAHP